MIKHAMIFAAGFGSRMRPLTNQTPKPLLQVDGKTMLERILDDLVDSGIDRIVINGHYLADQIEMFIQKYQENKKIEIKFIYEPDILETGGGIINAIDFFEGHDFMVVNGDNLFQHSLLSSNIYSEIIHCWNSSVMDSLFLLSRREESYGYRGKGDFDLSPSGQIVWSNNEYKKFVFAGVHITKTKHFVGLNIEKRSVMDIYRKIDFKNFYGYINASKWFHIGDPESLRYAEDKLKKIN